MLFNSPILTRTFNMLTFPSSALPDLPPPLTLSSYKSIHLYTLTQIILATIIFIVSLTKAAPAFPIIIIVLVPVRLLLMGKLWRRDVLRYVDRWACMEGGPEDGGEGVGEGDVDDIGRLAEKDKVEEGKLEEGKVPEEKVEERKKEGGETSDIEREVGDVAGVRQDEQWTHRRSKNVNNSTDGIDVDAIGPIDDDAYRRNTVIREVNSG